jgi:hypothetical protein
MTTELIKLLKAIPDKWDLDLSSVDTSHGYDIRVRLTNRITRKGIRFILTEDFITKCEDVALEVMIKEQIDKLK